MKKLFIAVLAAFAMVACTNDELVSIKGGDAIAFGDAFLDNATRAAVDPSLDSDNIKEVGFNVWAFMDEVEGTVFENEAVTWNGSAWTYTNTQYWAPSHTYYFAALAPIGGNWNLNTTNANKLGAGIVDFINADGGEDLIYAKQIVTTPADINAQPAAVKMQFQHLLSKVKFTFQNGFVNDNAKLVVKDIKMTAPQGGSIDLAVADYAKGWNLNGTDATFAFGDLEAEIGVGAKAESANERLTVPAAADYLYTITFTAELYMGDVLAQTFNETTQLTGIEFEMGKAYNLSANLNPGNLGLYPITFEVEVDAWETPTEVEVDVNAIYAKVSTADELAAALTNADAEYINVTLLNDIDLPINTLGTITGGSGEYKLGGATTQEINIDLNGKTLNITTTYWSALGCKNDDAVITIKNGNMTSTGNSAGTWNAWDLRFSNCNYVFEGVNFLKAVALDNAGKTVSMKNVNISDTHNTDTYGLWITSEGQTVTLEDCVIDMLAASDGRGIKIDNQYLASDAKVTLNVKNLTVKSEEKSAIMVKSTKGAEINVENIDITAVAADTQFAVWVDEDAKAYADLVVVNGAYCKVEGEDTTIVTTADDLKAALTSANAAVIALAAGEYDINEVVYMNAEKKIKANGDATIKGKLVANADFTAVNVKFAANAASTTDLNTSTYGSKVNANYSALVHVNLAAATFEGCEFDANQPAINYFTEATGKVLKVNNCVFNGGSFIYSKALFEVTNSTFATDGVVCVYAWPRYNSAVSTCKFVGNNANNAYAAVGFLTQSGNYDNMTVDVQKNTGVYNMKFAAVGGARFKTVTFVDGSDKFAINENGSFGGNL